MIIVNADPISIHPIYWECHVTIEPVFEDYLTAVEAIAKRHNFRVADLLMKKNRKPTEERSDKDTFMTSSRPGTLEGRTQLTNDMMALIAEMKSRNFTVWRYKIEAAVIDSRKTDALGLLA